MYIESVAERTLPLLWEHIAGSALDTADEAGDSALADKELLAGDAMQLPEAPPWFRC